MISFLIFALVHSSLDFIIYFMLFTLVASLGLHWLFMFSYYLVVVFAQLGLSLTF